MVMDDGPATSEKFTRMPLPTSRAAENEHGKDVVNA